MRTKPNLEQANPLVLAHHLKTLSVSMKEWQTNHRIPPVLLLTGQQGIGKRALAHSLAQWILCEKSGYSGGTLNACGECPSCLKLLSGNDVDFMEINPESSDDAADERPSTSGTLKIEQFRKLKASAGFSAHEGQHRIILIPYIDRMTVQAANSVLKLFEEPPPGWIFLLTTHDQTLLLPTSVSRCQILRLKPFSIQVIEQILIESGVDQQRSRICANLAQGSWERAFRFAEDEIWSQRKLLFALLRDPGSAIQPLIDWASQKPVYLDILIDFLEQWTADLIRWSLQSPRMDPQNFSWSNSDGKSDVAEYIRRITRSTLDLSQLRGFWMNQMERLSQARKESLAPLNRKLLIQSILLPWLSGHEGTR
jgi:DNA polymerase-3 subunit delta'